MRLIWKCPVRVAINPFFSTVGWSLASLVSGTTLVAMVLSLQATGPMLLRALTSQDMYLAGTFLLLLNALTIIRDFDFRYSTGLGGSSHPAGRLVAYSLSLIF